MTSGLRRTQLKVGNSVAPDGFPRGVIKTIERCSLESFIEGAPKLRWNCWTVRTEASKPLHKYLICDLGEEGIVLWKKTSIKTPPPNASLWMQRSGLEEMKNISHRGPKSYIYSMLVYHLNRQTKNQPSLYLIERLRKGRIFRYEGFWVN